MAFALRLSVLLAKDFVVVVEAGHGGASGRYKQWREVSYENAWCLSVMGLTR